MQVFIVSIVGLFLGATLLLFLLRTQIRRQITMTSAADDLVITFLCIMLLGLAIASFGLAVTMPLSL